MEEADQAFCIGKPRAQESYLAIERILEAARASGAGLVHPGYGFLSESAAFARAVGAADLVWIGPSPAQIETMGDKQRAREAAVAAGVPVLPGSARFAEGDLAGLEQAARAVGFPLLVKAAAGGGGIGMRRVDSPDKLVEVAAATQSMAARAFGNGAIYLERYIPRARHVEIQVFGFGDGARHSSVRARLLGAAPVPEGDRGMRGAGPAGRRSGNGWPRRRWRWRAPPTMPAPARSNMSSMRTRSNSSSWK